MYSLRPRLYSNKTLNNAELFKCIEAQKYL